MAPPSAPIPQSQFCGGDLNFQHQSQSQAQTQAQINALQQQNALLNQQLQNQTMTYIHHLQQLVTQPQTQQLPSTPSPPVQQPSSPPVPPEPSTPTLAPPSQPLPPPAPTINTEDSQPDEADSEGRSCGRCGES